MNTEIALPLNVSDDLVCRLCLCPCVFASNLLSSPSISASPMHKLPTLRLPLIYSLLCNIPKGCFVSNFPKYDLTTRNCEMVRSNNAYICL